jgi:glycerol-3-phosphate dehydrogenase (NAD(P)+)
MKVGIVGAGAWGTAIATVASENGHSIVLWAREHDVVREINEKRTNDRFLPGTHFAESVRATDRLADLHACDILINATPTQYTRAVLAELQPRDVVLVNLAKGIEIGTHFRVSEIVAEVAPSVSRYAVLSGPSHAEEVVQRMPTTVVCASRDTESSAVVQELLSTPSFRVYSSTDVVGVEIGGALKNVIAIAAGIVDGVGLGDNTKAALITRGLAEIARLSVALGADPQTLYGLAGLGDLYVTCASRHSRNRRVGERIGQGETLDAVTASMSAVAEGVTTTRAALELAASVGIELPITEQVAKILFEGVDPRYAIHALMTRQPRSEN